MFHRSGTLFFAICAWSVSTFHTLLLIFGEQNIILLMKRLEQLFFHKFVVCTTGTRGNFVIFINCNMLWAVGADISSTAGFFTCFDNVIHNLPPLYRLQHYLQRTTIVWSVWRYMQKSNFQLFPYFRNPNFVVWRQKIYNILFVLIIYGCFFLLFFFNVYIISKIYI